ncbi:MAG: pilus assembly protein CpaE [Anaerolineales bacterium]
MLSLDTAKRLKDAGLTWTPAEHDFFYVPIEGLDERVFVISDMSIMIEQMSGVEAVTFNGTAEWALDYLLLAEAVWVPTESQLRAELEKRLVVRAEVQPLLSLLTTADGYVCEIRMGEQLMRFEAFGANEAYGAALLHVMQVAD